MQEGLTTVAGDINARIAGRVRTLRADLGMTLDALAAKCQVSRSMLSLVERGESSPTAVVLDKIANGLGVPLATLFDDASAAPNPVSRPEDRTPWRDPQSGYVRRNISPANYPSPIQIVEVMPNASLFRNAVVPVAVAVSMLLAASPMRSRDQPPARLACLKPRVFQAGEIWSRPRTVLAAARPSPTARRPRTIVPPSE